MRSWLVLVSIWLGCLAAPGCGGADEDPGIETVYNPCQPVVIETDPDGLSRAESASIDRAAAMWRTAAAVQLRRQPLPGARRLPVYFDDGAGFMHGYYRDETGVITINHRLTDREHAITVAHELGHAFGLSHVDPARRASLMNPANLTQPLTDADAAALRRRWPNCPPPSVPADP